MSPPPFIVLGAGLTGLAAASRLGGEALLLEREAEVGGLCRTRVVNGFHFDCTGHWLHLAAPDMRRWVEELWPDALVELDRRAEIHLYGRRTPYPFQAHTYGLPSAVIADCLLGYFRAREARLCGRAAQPRTFADYILTHLGEGIAQHFMIPYNTKLWTVPPAELDHTWCRRFVPLPAPEEVVRGALAPGPQSQLGYNATFLYPRQGGIGGLGRRLQATLTGELRLGAAVVRLDWRARRLTLADGSTLAYRALVSTAPLADLLAMLVEPPSAVATAAAELRAISVTYWNVGLRGADRPDAPHWTYYPEPAVPFYRAGSTSAAVASMAPAGHRSLYVEVSHPRGAPCPVGDAELLAGLRAVGLCGAAEEPVVLERQLIDCAYVLMDGAYGHARATALDWLATQGILSVGRYGDWTYDSMEGALKSGLNAAARVREMT